MRAVGLSWTSQWLAREQMLETDEEGRRRVIVCKEEEDEGQEERETVFRIIDGGGGWVTEDWLSYSSEGKDDARCVLFFSPSIRLTHTHSLA